MTLNVPSVSYRLLILISLCLTLPGRADSAAPLVAGVDAVGLTVADLDRSVAFFRDVLTFEPVFEAEVAGADYERLFGVFGMRARVARLQLGDEVIELTQYLAPRGRPMPHDSRGNDRWFQHVAIIVSDMDEAYAHLRTHKVEHASTGPQTLPAWNANAAGIKAFYFRDPDGHFLEVLCFPPGKGDPKWQRLAEAADRLFLGIDHTAIVVDDTGASLAFYRDRLGLKVVGGSENYGDEQEHLNNVFGARLRITSLRGELGPAVELLEYLTPRDGRPYPSDSRANDLWHWQIRMPGASAAAGEQLFRISHTRAVSPGVVSLPDASLGYTGGLMLRDPDGHALLVTNP